MNGTVLVANRAEVVRRVHRTARRIGLGCAAVYTTHDAGQPFVREADVALPVTSYLARDEIVARAIEAAATHVHPGYGFLSEDAAFAQAVVDAGLIWVGPPPTVLALLGDKGTAKQLARKAGARVLDGYDGADQSDEVFAGAAHKLGFPLLVKPVAGGGGKGMFVVRSDADLRDALESARRTARSAFGDDRLLLE